MNRRCLIHFSLSADGHLNGQWSADAESFDVTAGIH